MKIRIEPRSLAVELTYDITSLIRLCPSLDTNSDHRLTPEELQQAVNAINQRLRLSIPFEVNEAPRSFGTLEPVQWPIEAGAAIEEVDYHAATSLVTFRYVQSLEEPISDVWIQFAFFEWLGNRHTVLAVIEHESQTTEVLFSVFEPDYLFDTGYVPPVPPISVEESLQETSPKIESGTIPKEQRRTQTTMWGRFKQFFVLGIEHILIGYDHILFLLALLIVSRFRDVVLIVTSFTVAHSITLGLATLEWVNPPPTLVETLIAATIVYTAIENLWIQDSKHRWKLTFGFGLIHGFGFAGVLRELGLPSVGYVRSLLAFNLGVEVGQLLIVSLLAVPLAILMSYRHAKTVQRFASLMIAFIGLGWFLERAFGLSWMPF